MWGPLRNARLTGDSGNQETVPNWRFSLTPTLSRWEREFCEDPDL